MKNNKKKPNKESGLNTTLLCTFVDKERLNNKVLEIFDKLNILDDKIYVLKLLDKQDKFILTYNCFNDNLNTEDVSNTINIHRKKQTNTLYTINAINLLFDINNNYDNRDVNWLNYKNCLLLSKDGSLLRLSTKLSYVIYGFEK